jgi:hypothetical protein
MKALLFASRALFVVALAAASLRAQSHVTPAPLGLPRLKSATRANDAAPLATGKFSVDDLSATGVTGANKGKRNDVDCLALDAGKEWSRPLRGNGRDVTFVSFQVYASQTTIIDIAGARLGITDGSMTNGLQLMFDDSITGTLQWKSVNFHVGAEKYDGKNLVPLPTLTVRLDPEAGTWDIYSGSRLLADNLPLIEAKKNDRRINIRAGSEGAWITGLVLADENPIYEDANANAIDDRFEISQRGALLPAGASKSERQLLAQQWRDSQRVKLPQAFFVQRLMPDAR